jgi:hypothetical protein
VDHFYSSIKFLLRWIRHFEQHCIMWLNACFPNPTSIIYELWKFCKIVMSIFKKQCFIFLQLAIRLMYCKYVSYWFFVMCCLFTTLYFYASCEARKWKRFKGSFRHFVCNSLPPLLPVLDIKSSSLKYNTVSGI